MLTVPAATPLTSPFASTVAIAGDADDHWNGTPDTVEFDASRATAVSCRVCPAPTDVGLGETTTLAIPTATNAVPLTPSLVAVMVTAPALSPVTRPVLDTTATASLLEPHPTTRSVRMVAPDLTVAESCTDAPTPMLLDGGATVTLVTARRLTLTVADPVLPSIVAKITALPAPTAVTTPVCETVATDGAPDVHDAGRPESGLPFASNATAASVVVCPTMRSEVGGEIWTLATATGVTVTSAVPL
jgi:hypothetical protein